MGSHGLPHQVRQFAGFFRLPSGPEQPGKLTRPQVCSPRWRAVCQRSSHCTPCLPFDCWSLTYAMLFPDLQFLKYRTPLETRLKLPRTNQTYLGNSSHGWTPQCLSGPNADLARPSVSSDSSSITFLSQQNRPHSRFPRGLGSPDR